MSKSFTVAELIEKLQGQNPNALVVLDCGGGQICKSVDEVPINRDALLSGIITTNNDRASDSRILSVILS